MQVSKYNLAVGYHAADFQLAVSVLDKLQTVKVGGLHSQGASWHIMQIGMGWR